MYSSDIIPIRETMFHVTMVIATLVNVLDDENHPWRLLDNENRPYSWYHGFSSDKLC